MDDIVLRYISKMLDFEASGHFVEALKLSDKMLEVFDSNYEEIQLERAKMEFRNGLDKEALIDFIGIYEVTENHEIYELILEAYYLPNKEKLKKTYYNNLEYLERYPHYRNVDIENEIEIVPLWQDEEILVCTNLQERVFHILKRHKKKIEEKKDQIVMVVNELWMDDILQYEERYRISLAFMDMDLPIYLVFDINYWGVFAQLYNLKKIMEKNRFVFLVGEDSLYQYLKEDMVILPSCCYFNGFYNSYGSVLSQIQREYSQEKQRNEEAIQQYYKDNADNILVNVKLRKPRILFWTSRFTTALQYHTRDAMQAAMRYGCETEILIEPDGIHRIRESYAIKCIAQFMPDIIFSIDHFRIGRSFIPKEIIWITWIQDDLPHILDKETPLKLQNRDFIMNHFAGWNVIEDVGYPVSRMMDAPIAANHYIYKKYELTDAEKREYGADICMVCHASDVENFTANILNRFEKASQIREIVESLLYDYSKLVQNEGMVLYTRDEMAGFIDEYAKNFYNMKFTEQLISCLSQQMMELSQRLFRQLLADWLIEAGYHNLKLWGNGWKKSPKYQAYAMGAAPNGEVLSKILQSTKIVLGNNFNVTGAARAWESMLSGAFYMSNYVPPEADAVDIRKILKEDENLVVFHSKEDLLNKVEYYLTHDAERKQMAEKGHQAALEKMTYDALIKKMLAFLADYFKEQKDSRL